ncbi:TlpA disulfide reductase family protein [Parabacteroides sp. AM08-6]|uniref:TlpA family protein disulfide reductase n=1 Tax=Parabacteroides sp. AM08-6 TaxID=2292053 RepID=UPI000EFE751A|nr:TlpA disulfide reductase family protein [Parabacteroides sp. AM08-6]RHJ77088.1 thiol:disulfide interchange protein [Parabacteroides sp. AM08-6]
MKYTTIGLLLFLLQSLCAQTVIENPSYKTRASSILTITKIERTKEATNLHVHAVFHPHWWISIGSDLYIEDVATGNKYYSDRMIGMEFGKETYFPDSGEMDFVMVYPPLPSTTTCINWIDPGCDWKTFEISLVPDKSKSIKNLDGIRGNWITQDGNNEWIVGLYDSLVIYQNDLWTYKEIQKKGKRYLVTLENKTGTSQLTFNPQKDGLCRISSQNLDILCGKGPNNQLKPTPSDEDFTDFFRSDTAYIQGYLRGYDSRLGFSTGMVYLGNEATREDFPTVIAIHPDGRFDCKLALKHPVSLYMYINNIRIPFYLEPGQKLTVYLDYESMLDYYRGHDYSALIKGICYMGESASICRGDSKTRELFEYDYEVRNDQKKLTPEQYRQKRSPILSKWKNMADSIIAADNYSPKAARMLRNSALMEYAVNMFDFTDMRWYMSLEDTTNQVLKIEEDDSYYDFLKEMPLDDYTLMACNRFSTFINRFEYMKFFSSRGYKRVVESDTDRVSSILNENEQAVNRLKEFLPTDKIPFALQIAQVRSSNYRMSSLRDESLSKRFIESVKANLSIPFLSEECDYMYDKIYSDKSGSFLLSEGRGKEIFTKIADKYKGKYLMVDFWATTCAPCRGGIERSAELRKKYRNHKDIDFIFITSDDESPEQDYVKYVEANLKDEDCYRIPASDYHYLRELFHFNGIPHYETLNREGRVLRESLLYENFEYGLLRLFEKEQENEE